MICCVLSAIFTALSLGSAMVSSIELVCSDCVPPSTAARPSNAVRTMLFSGCLSHSEQLGDLLEEVEVAVPEERQPRRELIDVETALQALLDVGEAVRQRERQL